MPQFSIQATASVLGYVATILLIGGFVLLLAGLGILDIKAITIAKGRKTVVVGLLMILLGIGGLLFDIVSPPPPPTELAEVTLTPIPTPAPPTFTPTSTPLPTATPVPLTDTPVPTATPRPTPTPTPTMEADPTVYDDFNNPTSGGYNRDLWTMFSEPGGQYQIVQQDGTMMFTQQGKPEKGTGLATLKSISLDRPTFFEARLMLSSEVNAGNVGLQIRVDFSPNESWYAECRVYQEDGKAWAVCSEKFWSQQEEWYYDSEPILVQLGSWHIVRIEVDPATMTFNYFINGQLVGSHIPRVADRLKKARFRLNMGIWGPSADAVTGYVDDVRIGPVQ